VRYKTIIYLVYFYSASALLVMQTAVLARGIPSVRPSVFPTHSGVLSRAMRFSASGRTSLLVSGEVKFMRIFAGDHTSGGVKVNYQKFDQ